MKPPQTFETFQFIPKKSFDVPEIDDRVYNDQLQNCGVNFYNIEKSNTKLWYGWKVLDTHEWIIAYEICYKIYNLLKNTHTPPAIFGANEWVRKNENIVLKIN